MSTSTRHLFWLAAIISVLSGCDRSQLTDSTGELRFVPERMDLGELFSGTSRSAELTVVNGGRAPLEVSWELPGHPWEISELPTPVLSGEVRTRITFHAGEPGIFEGVLRGRTANRTVSLTLSARSLRLPDCQTPPACHTSVFDVALGRCVESTLLDGTRCDPHTKCLTDAVCHAGRCTGSPIACDDGNACTVDSCNALSGCEFLPGPPCPGDGKCRVGTCDPVTGCGLAPAEDGTVCGARTCDAAQICIAGACVQRDPPDGFVCDEGSPCRPPGICLGSSCVQGDATALAPRWSRDTSSAVGSSEWLHDFVLEPSGEVSLMGFFSHPALRANGGSPLELSATARRCILWNGRLACADFGSPQFDGAVALVDLATGAPLWTFSLALARPDFAAETQALFMARVAAVGTDRLAALFEAYPAGTTPITDCRAYYLAMLDPGGGMAVATKVADPFLSTCNHPHPYGVTADRDGNVYLQFAPSTTANAPLAPGTPSLTVSYTRDAVQRWSRIDSYQGGELAVANGLLFPENARVPHDAVTGRPIGATPVPDRRLGRIVSDGMLYVRSPAPGGVTIDALDRSGDVVWTRSLPGGDMFLSPEIRFAEWAPRGGRSDLVVLATTARLGTIALTAFRARDGEELWSCGLPSDPAQIPQLFEIARGSLATMSNAGTCGPCDPPYADSQAMFQEFAVPGLSPAMAPWVGTFGGPGHDHLEDAFPLLQLRPVDVPSR